MSIVRRELVVPFQLTGISIDRDERSRIEIVAKTVGAVIVRIGVTGAPIHQVEIWVVAASHPRPTATALHDIR